MLRATCRRHQRIFGNRRWRGTGSLFAKIFFQAKRISRTVHTNNNYGNGTSAKHAENSNTYTRESSLFRSCYLCVMLFRSICFHVLPQTCTATFIYSVLPSMGTDRRCRRRIPVRKNQIRQTEQIVFRGVDCIRHQYAV